MKNELPEWAMNTGLEIANGSESLGATIARALVVAERRGIERAEKVAERRMALAREVTPEAAAALFVALPDAIRQLGEEP